MKATSKTKTSSRKHSLIKSRKSNKTKRKNSKNDFYDLNYVDVKKLKQFCKKHNLSTKGKKDVIIKRIITYITTGKKTDIPVMPSISKTTQKIPLKPDSKILHGSYKNDLVTRLFIKKLVGPHFHFTAFGQDWIMEQWLAGKPPTYQQFAKAWEQQYQKQKKEKNITRDEWAYLKFIQTYLDKHPKTPRTELMKLWKEEKEKKESKMLKILNKI